MRYKIIVWPGCPFLGKWDLARCKVRAFVALDSKKQDTAQRLVLGIKVGCVMCTLQIKRKQCNGRSRSKNEVKHNEQGHFMVM